IVVDTPPSRSALDFLEAPANFSSFIGGTLLNWLAGGSRWGYRALHLAARPFLGLVDRLVGSDMLDELADFAGNIRLLHGNAQRHAREIYRLMRSPVAGFAVITTLEQPAVLEAEFFTSKLREFS